MLSDEFIIKQDRWLDENVAERYKKEPLAQNWARIAKIQEELGEVVDAFILYTGQNPRKGKTGTFHKVCQELADVVITATLALQHLTNDLNTTKIHVRMREAEIRERTEMQDDAAYR